MKIYLHILLLFTLIFSAHTYGKGELINNSGYFIENTGQLPNEILFYGKSGNLEVLITKNDLYVNDFKMNNLPVLSDNTSQKQIIKYNHYSKISFPVNFSYDVVPSSIQKGKFSYFHGNEPDKWVSGLIKYKNISLNSKSNNLSIKLKFEENNFQMEFAWKSPKDIYNFNYFIETFQSNLQNNENMYLSDTFTKTRISKTDNILLKDDKYVFNLLSGDTTKIASQIFFSTYLGGDNYDYAEKIVTDKNGYIYIGGYTYSINFPISDSAFSKKINTIDILYPDCFVTKLDSSGKNIIFSTFIGGLYDDFAKGMKVDTSANVFLSGYTAFSKTFPTTFGSYSDSAKGGYDCFVLKLDSSGSKLLYSSAFGGDKDDYCNALDIDSIGEPVVTGYSTFSGTYPVTDSAFQKINNGAYDIFVTKLDSSFKSLIFSTLIGGKSDEFAQDIKFDSDGNSYITGATTSADFPVTKNALYSKLNDTTQSKTGSDIFIIKLNSDGSKLLYSTYLGGSDRDVAYGIDIDTYRNMYVTGYSESLNFPSKTFITDSSDTNLRRMKKPGDVIAAKIQSDGSKLIFATRIGGTSADRGYGLVVDQYNNLNITGSTSSKNFPVTENAFQKKFADTSKGSDAFLLKLSPDGKKLFYSSYLGGSRTDIAKGIFVDKSEIFYLTGSTESFDFPVTDSSISKTKSDTLMTDIFVTKIQPNFFIVTAGENKTICKGQGVLIDGFTDGGNGLKDISWQPSTGLDNPKNIQPYASPTKTTKYYVKVTDQNNRAVTDSVTIFVEPVQKAIIYGKRILRAKSKEIYWTDSSADNSYIWTINDGTIQSGQGTNKITVQWKTAMIAYLSLTVLNKFGCSDSTINYPIYIGNDFKYKLTSSGASNICDGDTVILNAGDGYQIYQWSDGANSQYDTVFSPGSYYVAVVDNLNKIGYSDTVTIAMLPKPGKPIVKFNGGVLQCQGIYSKYQWFWNDKIILGATTRTYVPQITAYYYVRVLNAYKCKNYSDSVYVNINSVIEPSNPININIYPNPSDGQINIRGSLDEPVDIKFKLCDLPGRILFESTDYFTESLFQKEISLESIPIGMYILLIQIRNEVYPFKVVISR